MSLSTANPPPILSVVEAVNAKRQFGAKGDGVTDDRAAIQSALDASLGPVYLPPGTYKVSDALVIPTRQRLFGAGRDASIIKGADTKAVVSTVSPFVTIEDLWITSQATGKPSHGVKLGIDGSTYVTHNNQLNRLRVTGCAIGIYNGKGDASSAVQCEMSLNDNNFITDGNQDYFACFKCMFNDSTGHGAQALGSGGLSVFGALFANCGSADVANRAIYCNAGLVYVNGSYFETVGGGNAGAVYIEGVSNAVIDINAATFNNGGVGAARALQLLSGFGTLYGGSWQGSFYNGAQVNCDGRVTGSTEWVATYFDVAPYRLGDYYAQTYDNSLPSPVANLRGKSFLQLAYLTFPYDELFTCIEISSGVYGWVNRNLNAYNITSNPGVAGRMWNNLGIATFS